MSASKHLVVGLGNPGEKYRYTRHNVAWLALDTLADRAGWKGGGKERDASKVHSGHVFGVDLVVAKPLTYMNESGSAVKKLLASEHVALERLLVVVDDFSIPFGALRFREGGSAGGHNGIASIIAELGTERFPRLRIGIGDPGGPGTAQRHVLGEFDAVQRVRLPELCLQASEAIESWARDGLNKAATAHNRNELPAPEPGSAADPANLPKAGDVDGPVGPDGIRRTQHGWRKPLDPDR